VLVPLFDEPEAGVVAVIVGAFVEEALAASAAAVEVPAVAVAIAVVDDDIERSTLHVWASIRNSIDRHWSTVEATVLTVAGMNVECNAHLVN
jgi:hypothetical protein